MDFDNDRYDEDFSEQWRSTGNSVDNNEAVSRGENRLLWSVYDSVIAKASKLGVPVDWVDDSLDAVVIGNYEVTEGAIIYQNTSGKSTRITCLDIVPHASGDMSKFKVEIDDADEVASFFDHHIEAYARALVVAN